MSKSLKDTLTAEKGLIFRITHRDNVPWILRNGLYCSRSEVRDSGFVSIGNPELIARRRSRQVPIPPGGTLDDYVPFYFTPASPMLYNITTGYGRIQRIPNEEIVVLVSSMEKLEITGVETIFTDRHAYLQTAQFLGNRSDLHFVSFDLLQERNFSRDKEKPDKMERYQAEALAFRHVPVKALLGLGCYTEGVKKEIDEDARNAGVILTSAVRYEWYFG